MTAERKAEQTAWLADAGTVGDVECRECGKRASNYRHYAHPSGHDCLSGCPEGLHHTFYPLPTESEPERESEPADIRNLLTWQTVQTKIVDVPYSPRTSEELPSSYPTYSVTVPAPETPSPEVERIADLVTEFDEIMVEHPDTGCPVIDGIGHDWIWRHHAELVAIMRMGLAAAKEQSR